MCDSVFNQIAAAVIMGVGTCTICSGRCNNNAAAHKEFLGALHSAFVVR